MQPKQEHQKQEQHKIMVGSSILVAISVCALFGSVDTQCSRNYPDDVAPGRKYTIASPNYPDNYNNETTRCQWHFLTAHNYRLRLTCEDINIPMSHKCMKDRFIVLPSQDGTRTLCGNGSLVLESKANTLTIQLHTSSPTPGGRFKCSVSSLSDSSNCMCGMKKNTRIVNGVEAGTNEFPFMAALADPMMMIVYCGATIVSSHYALTASHCINITDGRDVGLFVGAHDRRADMETSGTTFYRISGFIYHPDFYRPGAGLYDNDIALLHVDSAISMSNKAMPACLPFSFKEFDFADNTVEVAGWGSTTYNGKESIKLMKTELNVQTPKHCSEIYFQSNLSFRQMCTIGNNGSDTCQGDSGGGLFWRDERSGRWYVVGVVSNGVLCGNGGVNTRVTSYLDWIDSVINGEDKYCRM